MVFAQDLAAKFERLAVQGFSFVESFESSEHAGQIVYCYGEVFVVFAEGRLTNFYCFTKEIFRLGILSLSR